MQFVKLIHIKNKAEANKYSKTALCVWRDEYSPVLELDYKLLPKAGLEEKLRELQTEGEILNFEIVEEEARYKVFFSVPEASSSEVTDGSLIKTALIIEQYFTQN